MSDVDDTLYCDISSDDERPYIPQVLRRRVVSTVHNLSHSSGRNTVKTIAKKFVWPNMRKDVKDWARACLPCQRSKIHRHTKNPPLYIAIPNSRFQHIHIGMLGPLPESQGYRYCLTMVDRFTRWPEAVSIKDMTAETVGVAFYSGWIARFGAPATITTERDTQCESQLFQNLTQLLGTKRLRTIAYHPQGNGMVKRWHRSLKGAFTCHGVQDWVGILPTVLLGLRTCYKEDIKSTAAEMVYETTLRIPGEFS